MSENNMLEVLEQFYNAPNEALFDQKVIAMILGCSRSTLAQNRSKGVGIPFVKIDNLVRYKKSVVLDWIENSNRA